MMKCKEYVFKLTSGQLKEAPLSERLWATQHRLVCRHCRAFTRNDERISAILQNYKAQLTSPDQSTD